MSLLSKLFGYQGTVRVKGITMDDRNFSGKIEIECFGMNKEEIEDRLKEIFFVETGVQLKKLTIIGRT